MAAILNFGMQFFNKDFAEMFNYLLHYGRVQLLDGNHGEWRNGPESLELNNVRRTGPARTPASSSGRSEGSPSL